MSGTYSPALSNDGSTIQSVTTLSSNDIIQCNQENRARGNCQLINILTKNIKFLPPVIKDVVAYDNGGIYGINKDNQNIKINQQKSPLVVTDEFTVTQIKLNTSELQYSNVDLTSDDTISAIQLTRCGIRNVKENVNTFISKQIL